MLIYGLEVPVRCGIMISGDKSRDKVTGNLNIGFFVFEPFFVETLDEKVKKSLFRLESKFLEKFLGGSENFVTWLSDLARDLELNEKTIELLNMNFEAKLKEVYKENNVSSTEDLVKILLEKS